MKDLNFFEPYIEKKKLNIEKGIIYKIIALLSIAFIILYSLFNQIKIRQISKDIAKLKSIAEDENRNEEVEDINRKKEKVIEFKEFLEKIKVLDKTFEDNNIIDHSLLDNITFSMPKDLFFTSINISTDNIEIVGVSKDKLSIAELGKNLESVEEFKEIFVTNIYSQEEHYNFTLNINLKDVNIDGENSTIEDEAQTDKE